MNSLIDRPDFRGPIWLFLDSAGFGGIERHVEVLARELFRRDYSVEVVFWGMAPHPALVSALGDAGIPTRLLHSKFQALITAIHAEKPALIHTHGYKANILGRLAAKLTRTPVVSSYHAGLREPFPVGLYQRADELTSVFAPRIAVSEPVKAALPFSSTVIENFIATPPRPERKALPRRIVFAGRLTPEKGIDLFCAIAERATVDAEWHVYGEGPLRAELETRYGHLVQFHGFTGGMDAVWRESGLLLMPSRAEGLPMAAIEAIAHGVPVAAASVGGLPRIVEPGLTGWLFPAEDVAAASRAVQDWAALAHNAQQRFIEACWGHARAKFSASTGVPQMLAIYEHAAGARAQTPPG